MTVPEMLVAGQNARLHSDVVHIRTKPENVQGAFKVAIVALGNKELCWVDPGDGTPPHISADDMSLSVNLGKLDKGVQLQVLVYSNADRPSLSSLGSLRVELGGFEVSFGHEGLTVGCLVVADLYCRDGAWKIRAQNQGVVEGFGEYLRRQGLDIKLRGRPPQSEASASVAPRSAKADWTGSGCQISPRHVLTNAHVVSGASRIVVSNFAGRTTATAVVVDEMNDIAIVRLDEAYGERGAVFRTGGVMLGEEAVTLGYPLHGVLGSAPQFTSGSVSNLLGPDDDARVLQITAPIQPGSSGCPVFDGAGNVIGIATATLMQAQNVNFAVRASLATALMEATGIEVARREKSPSIEMAVLVKENSGLVWRMECFR